MGPSSLRCAAASAAVKLRARSVERAAAHGGNRNWKGFPGAAAADDCDAGLVFNASGVVWGTWKEQQQSNSDS